MDASTVYQIEEIARRSGLSKRTIRYYEEMGLLPPLGRSEGGYRLYTDRHLERLTQIVAARESLGLSLQQVHEFVTLVEQVDASVEVVRETPEPHRRESLTTLLGLLDRQKTLIAEQRAKIQALEAATDERRRRVLEALARAPKE